MENIKELLKKNIKGYEKTGKDISKLYQDLKNIDYYENKNQYFEIEKNQKIAHLENKIYKNNIRYLLINIIFNNIDIKNIYNKYKNKNIGNKTKEKITSELNNIFNLYGFNCYFNIKYDHNIDGSLYYINYYLSINFIKNYYDNFTFEIFDYMEEQEKFTSDFINEMASYNWIILQDQEKKYHKISLYDNVTEYVENPKQHAKKIYNQKQKTIDLLNKEIEKINNIYSNCNDSFNCYLCDDKIKKYDIKSIQIY